MPATRLHRLCSMPSLAVGLAWALLALTAAPASAQESGSPTPTPAPSVSSATILAANSYPGVQLISAEYTARISVAMPTIDQDAVVALGRRLATQAVLGGVDPTEAALREEIVDAVATSPDTYFVPSGRVRRQKERLLGVGTGWVITPDGYLITAAHVVKTSDKTLRRQFAQTSLTKFGRQFARSLQRSGTPFTRSQLDRLTEAVLGWLAGHMAVNNLRVTVSADVAVGSDGLGKDRHPVEAEVVDVGKPYPGSDVALLKIDGQTHLPTIAIGTDDDASPGSTVHVVGFPAASTFSPGLSRDAQAQPTVTEGPVTAVKSTDAGMPVIQTQAPASPGNSGGPVLTDNGASVGVLVANAVESNGTAAQGQNFVISASEVLDMVERNGVTPRESDTTATYRRAVEEFYAEHYKAALPLLEKVETLYPAHPFAQTFITDSKTAIDAGRDKTPPPPEPEGPGAWPWVLLALALAVMVLGAAAWQWRRRRQQRVTAADADAPDETAANPTDGWSPPPGWDPAAAGWIPAPRAAPTEAEHPVASAPTAPEPDTGGPAGHNRAGHNGAGHNGAGHRRAGHDTSEQR